MVVTGAGIATGTTITGVDATAGSITLSKPATAGNPTLSFGFSIVGSSYTSLVSEIGVNVQNAENVTANHENFMRQISNLRESNSGVSLDEELTNLVKYQRAFEGSAKLINVATEMLDTVLGLIR
jgi:flagellar hook-associated protein 1 FlgK